MSRPELFTPAPDTEDGRRPVAEARSGLADDPDGIAAPEMRRSASRGAGVPTPPFL